MATTTTPAAPLARPAAQRPHMLGRWAELLPLFAVRWLARHGRLLRLRMPGTALHFAVARPGVLVRCTDDEAQP